MVGCDVTYNSLLSNQNSKANLLVVPLGKTQEFSSAKAIEKFNGPVVFYVPPAATWFNAKYIKCYKDRILFAYGTDFSLLTHTKYANIGVPYHCIPFASSSSVMYPINLPKMYDAIFVGNPGSGQGRYSYVDQLLHVARDHKILLIGPGWEQYGFEAQSVAWGSILNVLYNLSHVCINIHNDEQRAGIESQLDANNRLFDLAMAGCLQISNAPQIVRKYFNETEVIAFEDPEKWAAEIMYFINHPEESIPFRIAARKRAMEEHTWKNRADQFVNIANTHLAVWQPKKSSVTLRFQQKVRSIFPSQPHRSFGRVVKKKIKNMLT